MRITAFITLGRPEIEAVGRVSMDDEYWLGVCKQSKARQGRATYHL
jgi:hypothetical protein